MGWMTTIGEWGSSLSKTALAVRENLTVRGVISGTVGSIHKTVSYLLKQLPAAFDVAYSVIAQKATQEAVERIGEVVIKDVVPAVALTIVGSAVQSQLLAFAGEDPNAGWTSASSLLHLSSSLLGWAVWAAKSSFVTRGTIRTVAAGNGFVKASLMQKEKPLKTICELEKCTFLRKFKGTFQNTLSYWIVRGMLFGISFIPYGGETIALLLMTNHDGRYVIGMATSDELCNHHLMEYLREQPELTWALGLGAAGITYFTSQGIHYLTGVPPEYISPALHQLVLFFEAGVAAKLPLPTPRQTSARPAIDPMNWVNLGTRFDDGFDLATRIVIAGGKKEIPKMFGKEPIVNWDKLGSWAKMGWEFGPTQKVKTFLLPPMVYDKNAFLEDKVIKPNFKDLRLTTLSILKSIINNQQGWTTWVMSSSPNTAALALYMTFGLPKFLTRLLLTLLYQPWLMYKVHQLYNFLEKMDPERPEIPVLEGAPPLRGQSQLPSPVGTKATTTQSSNVPTPSLPPVSVSTLDGSSSSIKTPTPSSPEKKRVDVSVLTGSLFKTTKVDTSLLGDTEVALPSQLKQRTPLSSPHSAAKSRIKLPI